MSILEILRFMRSKPQSNALNARLIDALNSMYDTTVLHLHSHFPLWVEDLQNLFRALQKVPALTSLNLESTRITKWASPYLRFDQFLEAGAIAIADALKSNTTLTSINLENNPIGINGATALIQALTENFTLRELRIGGYYIRDDQALALANSICSIQSRLITPELLIISVLKENYLAMFDAAFEDHTQQVYQNAASIKEALCVYFPEPLALIIGDYHTLVNVSPLLMSVQKTKKQKMIPQTELETECSHSGKKKKLLK